LALFRERDDRRGIIAVLNNQGVVTAQQGDRAAAEALFTAALDQARELGNQPIVGELLNNLGVMRVQAGDIDQARVLYEESLAHHRSMGLRHLESRVLLNLGWIALDQGRWADAEPLVTDALAIARTFQDQSSTIEALNVRGALAMHQGKHLDAQKDLLESLTLSRDLAYPEGAAYALEILAMDAVNRQLTPLGVQLFAAASTLRETVGVPNNPQEAARTEQACDAAHALVGDAIFSSAWASGTTLSLDAAIALARTIEGEDDKDLHSSSNTA
jgi:Tfp pilus assembly protein PilF